MIARHPSPIAGVLRRNFAPENTQKTSCFRRVRGLETAVILVFTRKLRAKYLEVQAALYFNKVSVIFGFLCAPDYKSASKFRRICGLIEFSLLSTPYRRRGHVTTRLAIPMRLRAAKRRTTRVFREKAAKNASSFEPVCTVTNFHRRYGDMPFQFWTFCTRIIIMNLFISLTQGFVSVPV